MAATSGTTVLFLDDSGKPETHDASKAVVIGGFSIASASVPAFSRRIGGAKSRFYPRLGDPSTWEVKARGTVRPHGWKRPKNRRFLAEVIRILSELDCTAYTVSINKSRMHHALTLKTTMPLQLQALVEHFAVECAARDETGLIVSDWSSHDLDAHASKQVASFVSARLLPLHPSVYYANSLSSHPIQVADLVAGIRRRTIEGDTNLRPLDAELAAIRALPADTKLTTHAGRPYTNRITLF